MRSFATATAPATEPITRDEAKLHLRVDHDADNDWIDRAITDARQFVENHTGRALVTQTWDLYQDSFNNLRYVEIPFPPMQAFPGDSGSVNTTDEDGTETEFDSDYYTADIAAAPARIYLNDGETWPTDLRTFRAIRVRFVAGYGAAAAVPAVIRNAMLRYIAYKWANRGDEKTGPDLYNSVILDLDQYKVLSL